MAILIILILIGVSLPIGAAIYIKFDSSPKKKNDDDYNVNFSKTPKNVKKNEREKKSAMNKLVNIKDIHNGKITCVDNKVRHIIGISSPDIPLLTDEEIEAMEITLMQFAISLNGSISFYTTPTRVETKEPAEKLKQTFESADIDVRDKLKEYARNLYGSYKHIENGNGVYIQKSFCVVGTNKRDPKRADEDIRYKLSMISQKLRNSRMRISLLSSEQTLQIFADIFQRGDNVLISKLEKAGVMELYSEGIGQAVYIDDKPQNEDDKATLDSAAEKN